jgi:hypothetical protein
MKKYKHNSNKAMRIEKLQRNSCKYSKVIVIEKETQKNSNTLIELLIFIALCDVIVKAESTYDLPSIIENSFTVPLLAGLSSNGILAGITNVICIDHDKNCTMQHVIGAAFLAVAIGIAILTLCIIISRKK